MPSRPRCAASAVDDLTAVAERAAALLIELPQRDLGGQQPDWEDLQAQVEWATGRGAAVHLDGARLWESAAGYGRPLAEIATLFDTVYVSFYKGIGALPGCCVPGPADIVAEVREWRQRMGGTLFGLWPNAASALSCQRRRLPLMPAYLRHARAIATALGNVAGVRVVPNPPQVRRPWRHRHRGKPGRDDDLRQRLHHQRRRRPRGCDGRVQRGHRRTLWVRKYRDAQAPTAVALSPDGSTLFVETGDYRTLAYNAITGHQRWVSSVRGLRKDSSATALAVSPDGLRLFVTGQSASNGRPWTYQTAAYDAAAGATRLLTAACPAQAWPHSRHQREATVCRGRC